jgi:hypothetical protein
LCEHLRVVFHATENIEQYDMHVIRINEIQKATLKYEYKVSDALICQIPSSICPGNLNFGHVINEENITTTCKNSTIELTDLPFLSVDLEDKAVPRKRKRKNKKADTPLMELQ